VRKKEADFLKYLLVCSKAILEKERKALSRCGIAVSDYFVLSKSNEVPPCNMSDIAKGICVSRSAITYGVDRLIARGLVRRSRGQDDDRRIIRIKVTPKGKSLLKGIQKKQNSFLEHSFSELPRDVQRMVAAFSAQWNACFPRAKRVTKKTIEAH